MKTENYGVEKSRRFEDFTLINNQRKETQQIEKEIRQQTRLKNYTKIQKQPIPEQNQ